MEKTEKFYLPEKYRNRLYTFAAGGYDGCIWHPAAVLVTSEGDVSLINSDGGAGGLDETRWYDRSMRAYLETKRVASIEGLYVGDKSGKAYREAVDYRNMIAEECRNRERIKVFEALEAELGGGEYHGWDHEFVEYDVSSPDAVRETCKALVNWGDKYMNAGIADALNDMGYEGAGCVCTKCGSYFEGSEVCERFSDCVDPDNYYGIGGFAVAHGVILCDDCRDSSQCPDCGELTLTDDHAGEDYAVRFLRHWVESCGGCVERFLDKNEKWRDELSDLEDKVDAGKRQLGKYLKVMEESGKTPKELERLEDENLKAIVSARRELVNEMRDRMEKDVNGFFNCPNASDRVGDGEDCDY